MQPKTVFIVQVRNSVRGVYDTKVEAIRSIAPQIRRVIEEDLSAFETHSYMNHLLNATREALQQEDLIGAYECMVAAFVCVDKQYELVIDESTYYSTSK